MLNFSIKAFIHLYRIHKKGFIIKINYDIIYDLLNYYSIEYTRILLYKMSAKNVEIFNEAQKICIFYNIKSVPFPVFNLHLFLDPSKALSILFHSLFLIFETDKNLRGSNQTEIYFQ